MVEKPSRKELYWRVIDSVAKINCGIIEYSIRKGILLRQIQALRQNVRQ